MNNIKLIGQVAFYGVVTFSSLNVCAQSSVTIFGVVDAAVRTASTEGAGHLNSINSGSYSSSRFGFRGQEDLGGGLAASFWLESFLNIDAGTATPAGFQRRSTVSLSKRDIGEIRLGRDFTPTHNNWARFDPFGYVGLGALTLYSLSATGAGPVSAAFGGNSTNSIQRVSNAVQYFLPRNNWGLEGSLTHSFRENGTVPNDFHQLNGGRLGIAKGSFILSAAYAQTRNNLTTLGAFTDAVIAGSYQIPWGRFSGGVRRYEYADASQNNFLIAGLIPFAGVHEFKFSLQRTEKSGSVAAVNISNDASNLTSVGYVYNFSKRTRLFATAATLRNQGNSRFVVPGAPGTTANNKNSRGFEIGLNQEF